jgi:hypothetical protein
MDTKRLDECIKALKYSISDRHSYDLDIEEMKTALSICQKVKEGKLVEPMSQDELGGQALFHDLAHRLIKRILEFNSDEHDIELNLCGIIEKAKLSTPRLTEAEYCCCNTAHKQGIKCPIHEPRLMEECPHDRRTAEKVHPIVTEYKCDKCDKTIYEICGQTSVNFNISDVIGTGKKPSVREEGRKK